MTARLPEPRPAGAAPPSAAGAAVSAVSTVSTIRPFLATTPHPTRPLGAALTQVVTEPAMSPWTPKPEVAAPTGPTAEEVAQLAAEARAAARAEGYAEGLAETDALRAQLHALIAAFTEAHAAIVEPSAALIADAAACVVETWIDHTHRSALFAPVVRSWLAQAAPEPATARVHPDDEAALIEALGDAPVAIEIDPAQAPGALELRGAARELVHDWHARLPELRTALIAALTGVET